MNFLSTPFALRPDGRLHLARVGEFPNVGDDGKRLIQVVDRTALDRVVAAWEDDGSRELLLDIDHESMDPAKRTTATAWLSELHVDDEGLWAKARWVDKTPAESGAYRYVSVAWTCQAMRGVPGQPQVTPVRILGAGLTNKPAISGLHAVSNRDAGAEPTHIQPAKTMEELKKIAAQLGLPETATVDEILARIATLNGDKSALETEVVANRTKEAESIADARGIAQEKRSEFVQAFVKNRSAIESVLSMLPAAAPTAPATQEAPKSKVATVIVNRDLAKPGATDTTSDAATAAKVRNRAKAIQAEQGCSFQQAFNLAQREFSA